MKKMIFRASLGKAYVQFFNLDQALYDFEGEELPYSIYFIIFPPSSTYLKQRL